MKEIEYKELLKTIDYYRMESYEIECEGDRGYNVAINDCKRILQDYYENHKED